MCEVLGPVLATKQKEKAVSLLPPWMEARPGTTLAGDGSCSTTKAWKAPVPRVGSPLLLQNLGHLPLCEGAKAGPCRERLQPGCPLLAS